MYQLQQTHLSGQNLYCTILLHFLGPRFAATPESRSITQEGVRSASTGHLPYPENDGFTGPEEDHYHVPFLLLYPNPEDNLSEGLHFLVHFLVLGSETVLLNIASKFAVPPWSRAVRGSLGCGHRFSQSFEWSFCAMMCIGESSSGREDPDIGKGASVGWRHRWPLFYSLVMERGWLPDGLSNSV